MVNIEIMYQRKCIKCFVQYEDKEDDDYYCSLCLEEKNKIAKRVDEAVKARGKSKREVISGLKYYDSLPKIHGFVNAKDFI